MSTLPEYWPDDAESAHRDLTTAWARLAEHIACLRSKLRAGRPHQIEALVSLMEMEHADTGASLDRLGALLAELPYDIEPGT